MTTFKTICQCFAKPAARNTLLVLAFAAFQFFNARSVAQPVVLGYGHTTNRFGPHSLPLLPVGDKVEIDAFLDSIDPVGSPTISVEAIQGGTTLTLDALPPGHPLYEGDHLYYKFIDLDPSLTGFWELVPTDSTGSGLSVFTNSIVDPEFLPLVENITVQGTPHGARVAWTLPNLTGFDVDFLAVRVIEATSGFHVFQSDIFSVQTTSYVPPAGTLEVGVDYVYMISLFDVDAGDLENRSNTFSQPFRFTIAGDFNTDGTVDAADYTVWRDGLGSTYSIVDYDVWKANFGQSLGAGSGVAPVVPEPHTWLLLALATICACFQRRKALN